MNKDLVSIIVVSCNRRDELLCCLHTIFKQNYKYYEVIVIDNASNDGSSEAVRNVFPKVLLIENERNKGTCVTRNQGVEVSNGEFVWFLDSDIEILSESYLSELVNIAKKNPQVGAIGGEAVIDGEGRCVGVKRVNILPNGFIRGEVITDCSYGELIHTDLVVTANFFIKKKYFLTVGGFDPWYFFFGEDLDLSYRLWALGFENVVFGKTPVFHKFSSKSRAASPFSFISHISSQKNRIYFCLKHLPLRNILALPLYDMFYLADPENMRRAMRYLEKFANYGAQATVRATMPESARRDLSTFTTLCRLMKIGFLTTLKICLGYICILPWIPYAIFKRYHRQENYLRVNVD